MKKLFPCLMILLLTAGMVPSHARLAGEYMTTIRPERLVTPCRPFAADYAHGPLKVLFMVRAWMAPREVSELKQRFNMEIDAMIFEGPPQVDRGTLADDSNVYTGAMEGTSTADKVATLIRQLSKPWDVIVVGTGIKVDSLPSHVRYLLLKQVADGAGLVVTGTKLSADLLAKPLASSPEEILAGVPLPLLKSYLLTQKTMPTPKAMVQTYAFGNGRIAVVTHYAVNGMEGYWQGCQAFTPGIPYSYQERVYYDYYLSLIAKTLLWAAPQKGSTVHPLVENPAAVTVPWAALPATVSAGTFTLPTGHPLIVKSALRDLFGKVTPLPDQPVKPGKPSLSYHLPILPQGDYFIDYRFVSAHGTEYWGSLGVAVTDAPATLQDITFSRARYLPDESVTAKITVTAPALTGLSLQVAGIDIYGREIFRGLYPVTQPTTVVHGELARCLAMPHYLRVELWNDTRCLHISRQDFLVAGKAPEFMNMIWGNTGPTLLGEVLSEQLRAAGINVLMGSGPEYAARHNQLHMDYFTHLSFPTADAKDPDASYYNPKWWNATAKNYIIAANQRKEFGNYIYSLGDENGYSYDWGKKVAPSDLQAYQQLLRGTYGTIQALNKEWGSNYQQFEEIPIADITKLNSMADIPQKHLWMHFCEKGYADMHHQVAQAIKEIDPTACVGAEGSPMGNPELTLAGLEMWGPYPSRLDNALMRSFSSPTTIRGNWWGGYVAARSAKSQPIWDQILTGGVNSNFYYTVFGEGCLSNDLSFADFFAQEQFQDIHEVVNSIGPLINRTPVEKMGLGLFYSLPSEHAITIDTRFGTPGSSRDGMLKFCEETGISSFFYSEQKIYAGKLKDDGVKILLLPQALCMSDTTVQRLRQWVTEGGILVADQQTVLRNERGAPRTAGPLDDIFGIQQDSLGAPKLVSVAGQLAPGIAVNWERVLVDTRVKAKTGKPALLLDNSIPLVITHQVGKGKAIFLNLSLGKILANYSADANTRAFVLAILKDAGIYTDLQAPAGYLITRFQGDGYELLSSRESTEGKDGETLLLGKNYHVYDVRKGKYLGAIDKLVPSSCAGRNNLFTLLPTRACAWKASFPKVVKPGDFAAVKIAMTPAVECCQPERLFRIDVFSPAGEALVAMQQYTAGKDAMTVSLPLALNQAPGAYRLEVKDILTGTVQVVPFQVK